MGIARVAILAADLAPSIGIDCPVKWLVATAASANPVSGFQLPIFHNRLGFQKAALGCESGDSYEWHPVIFAVYSPDVKCLAASVLKANAYLMIRYKFE
jgi:hypothetical protein